jgi:hypothetical protein
MELQLFSGGGKGAYNFAILRKHPQRVTRVTATGKNLSILTIASMTFQIFCPGLPYL